MASDNFTRANESPLASPWSSDSVLGGASLDSNHVTTFGGDKVSYHTSTAEDSQITVGTGSSAGNLGPAIHCNGAGTLYIANNYNSGQLTIYRISPGIFDNIGQTAITNVVPGDTLRLRRSGTHLIGSKNGVDVLDLIDTTFTGGYSGLFVGDTNAYISAWTDNVGGSSPTITDVNTTEVIADGQTGVAVTGTGMGTSNADRAFTLRQTGATVPQTETGTGTATAATLTVAVDQVGADIKFGSATLRVTRTSDSLYGDIAVTVNPASGQLYVDVGTPEANSLYRITAVGDIVSGDQIQARGQGGGAVPTGLSILSDGTWSFSMGNTPTAFDVRIWDQSDSTWGAWATQTISTAATIAWLRA